MNKQEILSNYIAGQIVKGRKLDSIIKECESVNIEKKIPQDKEVKTYEMKAVDFEGMTFSGYASTFDMDEMRDTILQGAFKRSINNRFKAGKIKVLWQHMEPMGLPLEMFEDEKGLYTKTQVSDTQLGRDAMTLIKDKVVDRMSIGFSIPAGKSDFEDDGFTRTIKEVKLFEYSAVTFPANEEAVIEMASRFAKNLNSESMTKQSKDKIRNLFKDSSQDTPSIDSDIIHSMRDLKSTLQSLKGD